ncbi:MAG: hypothetical protein A3H35_03230 [Betaproteobacteria bacterium RIFCSPLOWO2_02_FULL_62_17]|nr:MAG: hypothetical protein A3H35_03230 [Betaproteobacteria bacterium RIFCSPLOWO2_02_FULL_62_17]
MMDSFDLDFIGWFYATACGLAVLFGLGVFAVHYVRGQLKERYKDYNILNDVMLLMIWVIGFGGAIGVIDRSQWGQFLLQLFCWMLIALVVLSAASRMYTVYKLGQGVTRREWMHILVGMTLFVVPIVLFCVATILSLRTDIARVAFGIP